MFDDFNPAYLYLIVSLLCKKLKITPKQLAQYLGTEKSKSLKEFWNQSIEERIIINKKNGRN